MKRTTEQLEAITARARHRLADRQEETRYQQRLAAIARRFCLHPVDIEAIMRALGADATRFTGLH